MSIENVKEDPQTDKLKTGEGLTTGRNMLAINEQGWLRWAAGAVVVLLLIAYPLLNAGDTFGIGLLTETLTFGLFALSLNLLLGYTGLVSFGHAAYFGLGAYAVAIFVKRTANSNLLVSLLVGVAVAAIGALVLGYFSIRTSGIYFLMLTLAFSQLLYAIVFKWSDVTGGSDGLSVRKPELNLFGIELDLAQRVPYYFVVLLCFLIGFFIIRQVVRSPFGHTLVGIRDNEARLTALGYRTRNYKLVAFVLAGSLAGLAGVLHVYYNRLVTASELNWTTSGLVIVMVLLGGKGTLIGPVLGAFFIRYAELSIQQQTAQIGSFIVNERWLIVLGLIFIFFILLAPNGLVGLWQSLTGKSKVESRKPHVMEDGA